MKNKIKTGVVLTALALGLLHVINKCVCAASTLKSLLTWQDGERFHWRFGDIYYTKSGSGSPVLLIHDLSPYSSSYEWSLLEQDLREKHTVYTLDLLGCGRSDKPNITYTNYLYVQLVTDFIQKVIGCRTDVAATGLSSSFVVMACANNPEIFGKLLLVNPDSLLDLARIPTRRSKMAKFLLDLPIVGTAVYHIMVRQENIEYLFTEKYFYNPFRVTPCLVHTYQESAHLGDSHGKYLLSSINGHYVNINIGHALKNIDNSIFLILGSAQENAQELCESYIRLNPAVESVLIKNTRFLPQLEDPDAFFTNMDVFLQS